MARKGVFIVLAFFTVLSQAQNIESNGAVDRRLGYRSKQKSATFKGSSKSEKHSSRFVTGLSSYQEGTKVPRIAQFTKPFIPPQLSTPPDSIKTVNSSPSPRNSPAFTRGNIADKSTQEIKQSLPYELKLKVDEKAAQAEINKDWEFANSASYQAAASTPVIIPDRDEDMLSKYKKSVSEASRNQKVSNREARKSSGESSSLSSERMQQAYEDRKRRENNHRKERQGSGSRREEGEEDETAGESEKRLRSIEEEDNKKLMALIKPYLEQARVKGVIPRQEVVPKMRLDENMTTRGIKMFKRELMREGIDLDGGDPRKFPNRRYEEPCRESEEQSEEEGERHEDTEEEKEEKLEASVYGQEVKCLKKRRQGISPSNFALAKRTMNGSLPSEAICKCVNEDQPVKLPLRWLHIPKCGTSLGMSLIYYACDNVPDEIEILVKHAGINPTVPAHVESSFNYKQDCLKKGAFVSRAGIVGSHAPLDYTATWDGGFSKGHVVCFFRDPGQRIISAYWHSQHADGMAKTEWATMRAQVSEIERPMLHWREKVAHITHAQMTKNIPDLILEDYQKAMSIFFNWEGVQGCMTKMVMGYRCAEQGVELTPALVKQAESRLRNDFAFIGLTEEWDVSICLFHQMMGGSARELEFINYRAGKSTRTGSSSGYDARVLEGLRDPVDERIYQVAKAEFLNNLKKYSTCPENKGARFSSDHVLEAV